MRANRVGALLFRFEHQVAWSLRTWNILIYFAMIHRIPEYE